MGTYIICGILVIVVIAALLGSKKHFKGEGGCCGGGGDVKIKPKHLDTIVATKKLQIEGMSCVNCQNRIENALNGMAQVNAKASFKKGEAIVKLGADAPCARRAAVLVSAMKIPPETVCNTGIFPIRRENYAVTRKNT